MNNNREYVRCSMCGRKFVGKIPRGGDGSVLFPRKHWIVVTSPPLFLETGIEKYSIKEVCMGSFQAGEWIDE